MKNQTITKQKPTGFEMPEGLTPVQKRLWEALDKVENNFSGESYSEYFDAMNEFLDEQLNENFLST